MCRNIRTLHNFEPPATEEEIRASSLQYVRKVSGFTKPSQANAETFDRAVDEVAAELAPELDEGRPWSALVLREQRRSPRDPRHGLTMLLAPAAELELRVV